MMDGRPLYPHGHHPVRRNRSIDGLYEATALSRTEHPVRYYYIDFGLSRKYDASETNPLEAPIIGGDRTVPEFQKDDGRPCNPFPTDIYYLGNMIREDFMQVCFISALRLRLLGFIIAELLWLRLHEAAH